MIYFVLIWLVLERLENYDTRINYTVVNIESSYTTNEEKEMNKDELRSILVEFGFKPDRFGHMQKELKDGSKRTVKFQVISVRYEWKSEKGSQWYFKSSDYLKNIKLMDDGRLKIGRLAFKKMA